MLIRAAIFLGQSNAMNYSCSGQAYPGGWTPDSNFQIWTPSGFQTYSPGTNSYEVGSYWGPEAGYIAAFKASRKPQVPLYIIKHSIGSCGLAKKPGATLDFNPYSTGKEFQAAFDKIVAALNAMQATGKKAIVPSIFVVNGETDSVEQADAEAYYNNMVDFADGLRSRLWVHLSRVVVARIQDAAPNGPYRDIIRDAQDRFGTRTNCATVDTDDLPLSGSPLHFSPAANVTLGERFYAAEAA
jgi:hypothetical protein